MLADIDTLSDQLCHVQNHFGFDGWLVNIENELSLEEVTKMLEFVKLLRQKCHRVIWYDAVTVEGELKWQNGLTEKNRAFFDAAGVLFTNYTFKGFFLFFSHFKKYYKI